MTIKVYRVEDADGRGICVHSGSDACELYRTCTMKNGGKCECEHSSFTDCEDIPYDTARGLDRDMFELMDKGWSFAFPSLDALVTWFPSKEGRKAMEQANVKVVEYELDILSGILSNGYQCVFPKWRAKKSCSMDLSDLAMMKALKS